MRNCNAPHAPPHRPRRVCREERPLLPDGEGGVQLREVCRPELGRPEDPLGKCSELEDINWSVVGTTGSTAIRWVCYAANSGASSKAYPVREIAKQCQPIITPPDAGATVEVVIDGETVAGDYHAGDLPPSENDYSIALRIRYGDFILSTAGDLDGENSVSDYGYKYNNIETPVRKIVGVVDVYHANHHGSSHSSNKDFVNTLHPTVSLISCGKGNRYGHPTDQELGHMSAWSSKIFITQDCNPGVTKLDPTKQIVNDDILVYHPNDVKNFYVSNMSGTFKKDNPTLG